MFTLEIVLAGIVGTSVMMAVMSALRRLFPSRFGAAADMVGALGALISGDEPASRPMGTFLHYVAGVLFAFGYAALISLAPVGSLAGVFTLTGFVGIIHGMVVGLLFVITVAEHHPVLHYRTVRIGDALAQVIGHLTYGLSVGAVLGAFWRSYLFLGPRTAIRGGVGQFGEALGFAPIWLVLFGMPVAFVLAVFLLWGREARREDHLTAKDFHDESVHGHAVKRGEPEALVPPETIKRAG